MPTEPDNGTTADLDELFVADRLRGERPIPRPAFRGALGRYLASRDPGYGPRPPRLRLIVGSYLAAGGGLLALGTLLGLGTL